MVAASNKYIDIMDTKTQQRIRRNMGSLYESRKNFNSFIEEAADKRCPKGHYWCYTDKKCKKIPSGYHVGLRGYLVHDKKENGNGSNNGNGNGMAMVAMVMVATATAVVAMAVEESD